VCCVIYVVCAVLCLPCTLAADNSTIPATPYIQHTGNSYIKSMYSATTR
jgi:hypothetical protein